MSGAAVLLSSIPGSPRTSTNDQGIAIFSDVRTVGRFEGCAWKGDRIAGLRCFLKPSEDNACHVELGPSAHLEAFAEDEAGEPIPGARIKAETRYGGDWVAVADKDGRAQLQTLIPGSYTVEVFAEGFMPGSADVGAGPLSSRIRVRLKRAVEASGVVMDTEGAPIAGAWVSTHDTEGIDADLIGRNRCCGPAEQIRTLNNGHFALHALDRGPHQVEVKAEGFVTQRVGVVPPAKGIVIVLQRGATVRGRLLDANGEPVEQAYIGMKTPADPNAMYFDYTGTNGLFELRNVASGTYRIQASTPIQVRVTDTAPLCNQLTAKEFRVPEAGDAWIDLQFPTVHQGASGSEFLRPLAGDLLANTPATSQGAAAASVR